MNESPLLTVHILTIWIYLNHQVDREIIHDKICASDHLGYDHYSKISIKKSECPLENKKVSLFLSFCTHFSKIHSRKIKKFITIIKTLNTRIS